MNNSIVICMGSSCFARGNRAHLELIERYLDEHRVLAAIHLSGCRCRNECGHGPNIEINGTLHNAVDAGTLQDLLDYYFSELCMEKTYE